VGKGTKKEGKKRFDRKGRKKDDNKGKTKKIEMEK